MLKQTIERFREIESRSGVLALGITGGIGSGKSFVCRQLEAAGAKVFYCDDEAKRIIRTNADVKAELCALVGPEVYDSEGRLVKSVLAAYLCRGNDSAARVNAIVHPRVAEAWVDVVKSLGNENNPQNAPVPSVKANVGNGRTIVLNDLLRIAPSRLVVMECALLFESGFDRLVTESVLVHVSGATQLRRLMERDNITEEKARKWIALQLSEEEKLNRADWVLDNEHED